MEQFSSFSFTDFIFLLEGVWRTILISFISIFLGTVIGVVFGYMKSNFGFFSNIFIASILDVLRSVPLIIQLILFNTFLGILGYPLEAFYTGCIVLSLYTSAYVTEIVRSGIESVSPVTIKAARSIGLGYWQTYRYIILPLGFRAVLPSWIGIALSVIKDSALVSVIGYMELLKSSEILITRTQEPLLILLGVGIFYYIVSYPVSRYGAYLERNMKI